MSSSYAVLPSKSARPTKAPTLSCAADSFRGYSPVTDPVSSAPLQRPPRRRRAGRTPASAMATGGCGRRGGRGPRCSSARDNARAAATATRMPTWCRTSLRAASRPLHVPHYSSALSTERDVVRRPPALALPAPQSHVPIACDSLAHQAARETLTQFMGRGKGRCVDPWTDHQTRSCATDPGLFDDLSASAAGRRAPRTPLARASARCSALHGPGAGVPLGRSCTTTASRCACGELAGRPPGLWGPTLSAATRSRM